MADAIVYQLNNAINSETGPVEVLRIVIYAPFGVVRADVTATEIRKAAQTISDDHHLIQLQNVAVEHYSNHLPTGNYERLLLSTKKIAGLVIL